MDGDYYSKAVAYLTERPEEIPQAWESTSRHIAGLLFAFVKPTTASFVNPAGAMCGCPSQVRSGMDGWTPELTNAIREDERLPSRRCDGDGEQITVASLPVFAEWQRKIDKELHREPPIWREEGA